MRTRIRRRFRAALAVIMAVCILCAIPLAAKADYQMFSGNCGPNRADNAKWYFYSDNVLVISGEGATDNYYTSTENSDTDAPWADYYFATSMGFMQKIITAQGITKLGNKIFYVKPDNNYEVNLINLCDSLEEIGDYAFGYQKQISYMTIPQNVKKIGDNAFIGCSSLTTINCYANPDTLQWELATSGLNFDAEDFAIHVMSQDLEKYKGNYPAYAQYFHGDLSSPTNVVPKGKNILVSYDDISDYIFGGALPYSVKAVNSKGVWPITYGARGFVTCIKKDGNYYTLTDNNGTLNKIHIADAGVGRATSTTPETFSAASVKLNHEYIGANSVKVIYTVKNNTSSTQEFQLGSSGDIKIGLDDKATISPLKEDSKQIGIRMTSSLEYDKTDDGKGNKLSPTLGFICNNVGGSAADAKYFYGKVAPNINEAATGVRADILLPERVFSKGTYAISGINPYETDPPNEAESESLSSVDSGLSFYWNVTLQPNEEKEYAVIFSVPNTESGKENAAVIDEVKSNFSTNPDGFYTAGSKKIFFNNEIAPGSDDTLAQKNDYDTLKNFLLLGVQKKVSEHEGGNSLRYVTVVNTDILKDADEYGYIVARTQQSKDNINDVMIKNNVEYTSSGIYKKNIKASNNTISGKYGIYNADTHYKYVTLGIDDIPETDVDKTLIVRFYVVNKNGDISYAKYINRGGDERDGCTASYTDVINAANAQGGNS